jgi:hypothetical protein
VTRLREIGVRFYQLSFSEKSEIAGRLKLLERWRTPLTNSAGRSGAPVSTRFAQRTYRASRVPVAAGMRPVRHERDSGGCRMRLRRWEASVGCPARALGIYPGPGVVAEPLGGRARPRSEHRQGILIATLALLEARDAGRGAAA